MIDRFCEYLTNKIRKQMPEVDDERAEVILYGIQLIIGEIPKILLTFIIATFLGILPETLIAFFFLLPYKMVVGGVHLNTHIGCIVMTNLVYCGNAWLSSHIVLPYSAKIAFILINALLGIIMITKYAPADTINVPILSKKERNSKKLFSYIFLTINLLISLFIPDIIISNIFIFGTLIQTLSITRIAYKLAKNEYGYETYIKQNSNA